MMEMQGMHRVCALIDPQFINFVYETLLRFTIAKATITISQYSVIMPIILYTRSALRIARAMCQNCERLLKDHRHYYCQCY